MCAHTHYTGVEEHKLWHLELSCSCPCSPVRCAMCILVSSYLSYILIPKYQNQEYPFVPCRWSACRKKLKQSRVNSWICSLTKLRTESSLQLYRTAHNYLSSLWIAMLPARRHCSQSIVVDVVLVNQCCLPGNNGLNSRSGPHSISANVTLLKGDLL